MRFDASLQSRVTANLASFERREEESAELRKAAVAVVLVPNDDGEASFVLTRRPSTMRRHAGQYALPGGRCDEGETSAEAALRETEEEIGLALEATSILGWLDDYATRSGFRIRPAVVWGGEAPRFDPNPREVAALYRVPVTALMGDDVVHRDPIEESDRLVLSLSLLNNRIFAPTAALLLQFRDVALLGRATRVSHYEQPVFAWR